MQWLPPRSKRLGGPGDLSRAGASAVELGGLLVDREHPCRDGNAIGGNGAHLPAEPESVGEVRARAGGAITSGDNAVFYVGNLRCESRCLGEGPALKAQCRVELFGGRKGAAIACGGKHRPMTIVVR